MNRKFTTVCLAGILAPGLAGAPAKAQLSNMMQNMGGGGMMGGTPSLSSASPTNLAGVLQYCVQNNYLGGASASSAESAKSGLLSKFTGSSEAPSNNSGYSNGASGLLDTGNGKTTSLGGGGLKQQVTHKVCGMVLDHAKSML